MPDGVDRELEAAILEVLDRRRDELFGEPPPGPSIEERMKAALAEDTPLPKNPNPLELPPLPDLRELAVDAVGHLAVDPVLCPLRVLLLLPLLDRARSDAGADATMLAVVEDSSGAIAANAPRLGGRVGRRASASDAPPPRRR